MSRDKEGVAQTQPVPLGLVLLKCSNPECLAVYTDDIEGHQSHRAVFGHPPNYEGKLL